MGIAKSIKKHRDCELSPNQRIDYGYVTWYISDEKKIYEYKNEPITYFKNGIKYGIATY